MYDLSNGNKTSLMKSMSEQNTSKVARINHLMINILNFLANLHILLIDVES